MNHDSGIRWDCTKLFVVVRSSLLFFILILMKQSNNDIEPSCYFLLRLIIVVNLHTREKQVHKLIASLSKVCHIALPCCHIVRNYNLKTDSHIHSNVLAHTTTLSPSPIGILLHLVLIVIAITVIKTLSICTVGVTETASFFGSSSPYAKSVASFLTVAGSKNTRFCEIKVFSVPN